MGKLGCRWPVVLALALVVVSMACAGSNEPARLTLQWAPDGDSVGVVTPSQSVKSQVVVHNDGGADLDFVALRFNQNEAGQLPFGVSVGTVTHVSSRFEGESQVWDLGGLRAGDSVVFPITLWFEASSRTAEPATVRLLMVASSPSLAGEVTSNLFEVRVDARQASGR